ncbi:hypothetical protein EC973_009388 [Apophysomyces ossiformis]|uniref:UFSP1/2/DUB catalytic domain-containing protein n=1 Tax=Apophysomyces ossiformis TaxID=679940 RepID=A0A8H7BP95_9FUNG|nr:hypothetical protein EC973_009388 [Apophysomyces ossiformis]
MADLSDQGDRRPTKRYQSGYARDVINADDELWDTLGLLRSESRTEVIPRLEANFTNSKRKATIAAIYLCSPYTDHIATGPMDLGWGCGYRNCEMLMTFLERYRQAGAPALKQVPDIPGLQLLLEKAWEQGFDQLGRQQLGHRVYQTRKWIGTTEVYTMLVYLGIRCSIIDFHQRSGPNNSHDTLFDWIQYYFEGPKEEKEKPKPNQNALDMLMQSSRQKLVHITDRPPLYLQHSGHSRTVVGIELLKDGNRNLIMFDPGRRMLRSARSFHLPLRNGPEDDMDESNALSPATTGDEGDDDGYDSGTSTPSREDAKKSITAEHTSRVHESLARSHPTLSSSIFQPVRVDAKAIARNRQYQLLVLGEVTDERVNGGNIVWHEEKGYLLEHWEREAMKDVTSIRAL